MKSNIQFSPSPSRSPSVVSAANETNIIMTVRSETMGSSKRVVWHVLTCNHAWQGHRVRMSWLGENDSSKPIATEHTPVLSGHFFGLAANYG